MGQEALNLASLNVRGLKDLTRCSRLLGELSNLGVNIAAMQETHFICAVDCRPLEGDFVVFSAFGSRCSARVSLLVGRSLNANFGWLRFMRPILLVRDAPPFGSWSCSNG